MAESKKFTITIAGNPNCGKTALFNALTGSHQIVGNWPGVTVEKKEGSFTLDGRSIHVVDLPGIYALFANSEDERAAVDYLLSREANLIINIVDGTNLERNLFLTTQLAEMQVPMVIVVNMMDIAKQRGINIDIEKLSAEFGVPAFPVVAVSDKSVGKFVQQLAQILKQEPALPKEMTHSEVIEGVVAEVGKQLAPVAGQLHATERWTALQYLAKSNYVTKLTAEAGIAIDDATITEKFGGEESEFAIADSRYAYAHKVASETVTDSKTGLTFSDKIDKVFLNRILGIPIFLIIMYLVFWVAVSIGSAFIDFFDILFGGIFVDGLTLLLESIGAPGFVIAIVASGIGAGIQTVSTFIPVVFFMFLCLSILEDSGYMARAAFVADRAMRFIGLPGRSFVPLIVGFGCGVPAIMGSRVLENRRERFLTIFLVPFMSCGARLPVYALFGAAFFGAQAGAMVFALYLAGIIIAFLFGLLLRHTMFKGKASAFVMELPPYHLPRPRSIWRHTWTRLKEFMMRAGKVVVVMVTILGFINSIGTDGSFGNEDSEESVLSVIGKAITPIFEPFGVEEDNWPASVALFSGLFAKEAVVGTLNSLYSIVDAEEEEAEEAKEAKAEEVAEAPAAAEEVAAPAEGEAVEAAPAEGEKAEVAETAAPAEGEVAEGEKAEVAAAAPAEEETSEAPAEEAAAPAAAEEVAAAEEEGEEEEEEEEYSLIAIIEEALLTIPDNLSGIFGALLAPLGVEESVEGTLLMDLKEKALDRIAGAKILTDEEFAALEEPGEEEEDEAATEAALEKVKAWNETAKVLDEELLTALEEGELDEEQTAALSGMRKYFTKGGDGINFQVFAYLLFILLYVPCLAALGTAFHELGSFYGTVLAVVQTLLGWSLSVLLYQLTTGHEALWIVVGFIILVAIVAALKFIGTTSKRIQ